ncbi:MAG: SDR family oxidoreductase [Anaerolineales bacterium]|jgi:gluconate 5-dehydrogenase
MGGRVKNKNILITGATSGLGYAMAEALLGEGATVAIASRSEEKLDQAVEQLKKVSDRVVKILLDVRFEQSVANAVAWVAAEWGRLDVLINNAGIGMKTVNPRFMTTPQPFFEIELDRFRDLMDTNLTGYFLVSRGFAPLMVKQGRGRIINISMNYETMKRRGFIPYGPSRAAVESLSIIMAEDLKPYGITVNRLLPGGATATGMIPDDKEIRAEVLAHMNLLPPSIMAKPVIFLCSDEAEGITGERIVAIDFDAWLKARSNSPASKAA